MQVRKVVSLHPDRLASSPSSPVLVGRDREQSMLLDALLRPPAVVVIEGEPGIGKTRLVEETLRDPALRGRTILRGAALPLREPHLLGPVLDAIRDSAEGLPKNLDPVCGALAPLLPELAGRLPSLAETVAGMATDRHMVFRAILELLRACRNPVLVVEDVHWADEATCDFLLFLASRITSRASLVLTYRAEDLPRDLAISSVLSRARPGATAVRVALRPLELDGVRSLAAYLLETETVPVEFAASLRDRTAGIPFSVEELLHLLVERRQTSRKPGNEWDQGSMDALGVPHGVREMVLQRLAGLSEDARVVVEAVAVLGAASDERTAGTTARLPAVRLRSAISEALAHKMLIETADARLDFRHSLARQAIYDHVALIDRPALHLRAARALARSPEPPLGALAHHLGRANRPAEWRRATEAAADAAVASGDHAAAAAYLCDLLEAADLNGPAKGRISRKLGRVAARGNTGQERALAFLRAAADDMRVPRAERARVLVWMGRLLRQLGRDREARRAFLRCVDLDRGGPSTSIAAMDGLATPSVDHHIEEHGAWLARATLAAEKLSMPAMDVTLRLRHASFLVATGDPAGWGFVFDVPFDIADIDVANGAAIGFVNLAGESFKIGYGGRAATFLDRACRTIGERRQPRLARIIEVVGLLLAWGRGEWPAARKRFRAMDEDLGAFKQLRSTMILVQASLALAEGDLEQAARCFEEACASGRNAAHPWVALRGAGGSIEVHTALGDADAARLAALGALEIVRTTGLWTWSHEVLPSAVLALATSGERRAASALISETSQALTSLSAPAAAAGLLEARGHLSRGDRARSLYLRAARAWAALPRPIEAARSLEAAAMATADPQQAVATLREALAIVEPAGADRDAARMRLALTDRGALVARSSGGRRGFGSALSPQERAVARLVAEGLTSRQIAEQMFLSPRTVEDHVARAMRKLGARTRAALVAAILSISSKTDNP